MKGTKDLFRQGVSVSARIAIQHFHKHTKLAIIVLMPTLYSHVFTVFFYYLQHVMLVIVILYVC